MSADWLKRAGYLGTEDLDAMQYNYIANKQKTEPKVDAIGKTIDLKKTSGTQLTEILPEKNLMVDPPL